MSEYAHRCLTCGCTIAKGEAEIMVPGQTIRYMHETYEGCQAALDKPVTHVRHDGGRIRTYPTLDQTERNG